MAASATPRPRAADPGAALIPQLPAPPFPASAAIDAAVSAASPRLPLAVALSGGADSTALLWAAARRWPDQVQAIHIHHGLQAAADDFVHHCQALCAQWPLPLHIVRVQAGHACGQSPEDAARRARYAALADAARAQGVATVWLGQHADDQAETLLLALSRGAGLPGLAAMPARFERQGMVFERPLLELPGLALRQALQEQGINWIEDPTNADTRLTRNRIRQGLLPALQAAFPAFRETFARSSRHAAQAQRLLAQVAADDLSAMGGQPRLAALQALSPERQANLLRYWLRVAHQVAPSAAQLDELQHQVQACRTRGHGLQIKVARGVVVRAGELLVYQGAD